MLYAKSLKFWLFFLRIVPEGCKYFREYLRQNKNIFLKIFWGLCIHEKTRAQKSHATFPLKGQCHKIFESWVLHQIGPPGTLG